VEQIDEGSERKDCLDILDIWTGGDATNLDILDDILGLVWTVQSGPKRKDAETELETFKLLKQNLRPSNPPFS
jgi:hypothetical protein